VPGLATDDDPVNAAQVDPPEVFQQRLDGQEANVRIHLAQVRDARNPVPLVFDRHPKPNISRAGAASKVFR